jgi:hypothetical protein
LGKLDAQNAHLVASTGISLQQYKHVFVIFFGSSRRNAAAYDLTRKNTINVTSKKVNKAVKKEP